MYAGPRGTEAVKNLFMAQRIKESERLNFFDSHLDL